MPKLPYQALAVHSSGLTVFASGAHLVLLLSNGREAKTHTSAHSGPVRLVALTSDGAHVVSTGDDKKLKVWGVAADGAMEEKSARDLVKRANALALTSDDSTILIADKFGDVFSFPLHPSPAAAAPSTAAGEPAPKKAKLAQEPVLGHVSMVNALALTPDGKHVITGDRDEHVRVSRFPKSYVIERFCLGHRKFVSALLPLPAPNHPLLLSAGGDPAILVWDYLSGALQRVVPVADSVLPGVKVRSVRVNDKQRPPRPPQGKKAKGKKGEEGETKEEAKEEQVQEEKEERKEPYGDLIVAINKLYLYTPPSDPSAPQVLFTSCGSSNLHYLPLTSFTSDSITAPEVQTIDFAAPVLDFAERAGNVLVSVDRNWEGLGGEAKEGLRALKWEGGKFVDAPEEPLPAVAESASIEADSASLAPLDLYSALALLPKMENEDEDELDAAAGEGKSQKKQKQPANVGVGGRTGEKQRAREATERERKKTKVEGAEA